MLEHERCLVSTAGGLRMVKVVVLQEARSEEATEGAGSGKEHPLVSPQHLQAPKARRRVESWVGSTGTLGSHGAVFR